MEDKSEAEKPPLPDTPTRPATIYLSLFRSRPTASSLGPRIR